MRKPGLTLLSIATPLLLLVAGCGAVNAPAGSSTGALVISAEKATIDTTTTNQLSATSVSGAPASVTWAIVGGAERSFLWPRLHQQKWLVYAANLAFAGPGANPGHGDLPGHPAATATYPLTVTPGFVQVLTPETASLAPGGTVQVTGEIAEVNSGSIQWSLGTTPGVKSTRAIATAASVKPGALTPAAATPPVPQPIPLPVPCPRETLLFLWSGLPPEIPTPQLPFTFC